MWTENVVVGSAVVPGLCACTRVEFELSVRKGEPGRAGLGADHYGMLFLLRLPVETGKARVGAILLVGAYWV